MDANNTEKNVQKIRNNSYYLGLDIGTNSVGFAVTDTDYNLLKKKGIPLWGIRLFESGETAVVRRQFRSSRRRLQRRKQRIELLQEFFAPEISKIDMGFYHRLKESFFQVEDKRVKQTNTLFSDVDFKDKDYHEKYPTIYHLRKALMDNGENKEKIDIRLYYLAIAHILKKRGHFLFEGQDMQGKNSFNEFFEQFAAAVYDFVDPANEETGKINWIETIDISKIAKLKEYLSERISITDKKRKLYELFEAKDKQEKKFLDLLSGAKVSFYDLFLIEDLKDVEVKGISFSDLNYEESREKIAEFLGDRIVCIDYAKALYDCGLLSRILGENEYLSDAKIESYKKHKSDLQILKTFIKENCAKEIYHEMFTDNGNKNNKADKAKSATSYMAYTGKYNINNNSSTCSATDFYKFIKGEIVEKVSALVESKEYILKEIEKDNFLPRQSTGNNGVIPHQLHLKELKLILKNASFHYDCLREKDASDFSVAEKIEKLMLFRIPYYIGPLNPAHKKEETRSNCWVIRKEAGKVYPWNFNAKIDVDNTAAQFILQMTNKCTYLIRTDVLPKNSLLYSKFMVLNELNNLKINANSIDISLKQNIYNDLFLKHKSVTQKRLKEYLVAKGSFEKNDMTKDSISGIDGNFKASMKSLLDLKDILQEKANDSELCEEIIKTITLFGQEKKLILERLKVSFGEKFSDEEIKKLSNLKYSGWGNLSKEFLSKIEGNNEESGEVFTIIDRLYNSNENLMQLLHKHNFLAVIEEYNKKDQVDNEEFTYNNLVAPLYCSPAVKRGVWQALKIAGEIKSIMGTEPEKIFIEVAREEDKKKQRTKSRKEMLMELYKKCKQEEKEFAEIWTERLKGESDEKLRSKKLYLYYTQMGRCMYSGEEISLNELMNNNSYDIDHIYPQSKIKDDSFDNLVLSRKDVNNNIKKNFYPIPASLRTESTRNLWERLRKMELISKTKYNRLVRTEDLNDEELAGFINRQLVETRQSSKAVAKILQKLFTESRLVYSKAGNVSDFRQEFDLIKVRELNDLHHAEDAYLNIVVGNVHDTKFTANALYFIKNRKTDKNNGKYNLNRMYDFDIERAGKTAWKAGTELRAKDKSNQEKIICLSTDFQADFEKFGTMATVIKNIQNSRVLFTRQQLEETGEFYNQQILKKGHGQVPLKGKDERLSIENYGGYDNDSAAYYIFVKHLEKKKEIRSIEYVPVRLAKQIEENKLSLQEYCAGVLQLTEPEILLAKIKRFTLFKINGFPMHFTGRGGNQLFFAPAVQFYLKDEYKNYFKKIVKFNIRNNQNPKKDTVITEYDGISKDKNQSLYAEFLNKLEAAIYKLRPNSQFDKLKKGQEIFAELSVEKQCIGLYNILSLFKCFKGTADLSLVGGTANAGQASKNKKLNKEEQPKIIHQSYAGFYTKEIDLYSL